MSGRFHFRKSWGAEPVEGGARFRLWAPAQETMALRAAGSGRDLPMREAGEGWFEIETDAVRPGEGYSFVLADGMAVADPAARAQIGDVHGPSRLVDPARIRMVDRRLARPAAGKRPSSTSCMSAPSRPRARSTACARRLDHLADIGVTAIELMPVAQFGGNRGWGYDGVLLYAPHVAYGGPEGLKRLVDAAHERGLMVFLDVVYNHFGPDGNYLAPLCARLLPSGAPHALGQRHRLREAAGARVLHRERALLAGGIPLDGLRLDAIDQIADQSEEPLLEELALAVRRHCRRASRASDHRGRPQHRPPARARRRMAPSALYSAEWNDDFHHAAHVIATGEHDGYYSDYSRDPVGDLARALATGFVYQGEPSPYRDDAPRGESRARICRRPPSSISCRTTTRSATAPSASGSTALARAGDRREPDGDPAAQPAHPAPLHGRGMGRDAALRVLHRFSRRARRRWCAKAAAASSPSGCILPARRAAS